jgi:hypothetical protein
MPHWKDKKHASDLSPYPLKLISFKPVAGSDNQYGHLHKPIKASPFKDAGIDGFKPISPFKVMANYLTADSALAFHWSSLLELNDDIAPFPWLSEEERRLYLSGDTVTTSRSCIQAPLRHCKVILFLLFPNSTPLFTQSFKVLTAFSLFHIALVRMKPANGV